MDGLRTSARAVGKGWYFTLRSSFLGGKQNLLPCMQSPDLQIFMQELQQYLLTTSEMEGVVWFCLLFTQSMWGGGT